MRLGIGCLAFSLVLASHAHAAQGQVQGGGTTYSLTTNTAGGTCYVQDLGTGGVDVDCDDGAGNRAKANSLSGCILTTGRGQCYTGGAPNHTNSSIDMKCGSTTYTLSTGTTGGSCSTQKDASGHTTSGSCSDGNNTSSADCSGNGGSGQCSSTSGNGSCSIKT